MRRLFALAFVIFALPAYAAPILINDGLSHVIDDYTYSSDGLRVQNIGCNAAVEHPCVSPGAPTQLALVEGGRIGDYIEVWDSSTILVSGGQVGPNLLASDSAAITMSGGVIDNDLIGWYSSTILMSDGSVGRNLSANGSSTVTLSGGAVGAYLYVHDHSTVTMTGGAVLGRVHATSFGSITVSGGWVNMTLEAKESSTITIVGHDFEVNGSPVPYGELALLFGRLTGTLASGESIDNIFYQGGGGYSGTITLIPEPTTFLLIATGLVGLAAAGRRRSLQ